MHQKNPDKETFIMAFFTQARLLLWDRLSAKDGGQVVFDLAVCPIRMPCLRAARHAPTTAWTPAKAPRPRALPRKHSRATGRGRPSSDRHLRRTSSHCSQSQSKAGG